MAFALTVDKLDPGGKITVRHIFYGATLGECERLRDQHAAGCQAFGPALQADKVLETSEEIDDEEVPAWADGE